MGAIRLLCGSFRGPQLCLLLLAASLAILTTTAEAKPSHIKNKDDFKSCGGALKCLGAQKLGRVRRRSGLGHKSVQEIAALLDTDGDLNLDDSADTLLYTCAGMIPDPEEAAAAAVGLESTLTSAEAVPVYDTAGGTAATEAPHHHHHHHHHRHLAQTPSSEIANAWTPDVPDAPISQVDAFRLHSRPNAIKKILLDFDGHITQNSAWNVGRAAQIITPPYDKDGSPSTWSAGELSDILAIWRGVSEDFAPWDVDVTTEDPGDVYLAANGMRVAIGGSGDWYGSAGGVAYVGYFGKGLSTQPAFVFAAALGNNAKYIWEAVSHETGHTLGLNHDGIAGGTAYYGGTTASPKLWAPIMGSSYSCAVTQWSKGEYSGANNLEDDMQIISSYLGAASTNDLVGGTFATATPLPATRNGDGLTSTGASYGVIQGSSDVDMFSFTATAAGTVQVTVTAPPRFGTSWAWARSNMAIGVAVLDASNNVLAAASGLGTNGVSTSVVVPAAGTYYVSLSGVGMNDPATTGFSNYASTGQYKVTATYPIKSPPASS